MEMIRLAFGRIYISGNSPLCIVFPGLVMTWFGRELMLLGISFGGMMPCELDAHMWRILKDRNFLILVS